VRNPTLHGILAAFTTDAAGQLAAETAGGAEVDFELIEAEGRPGRTALYCYRPLTGEFIDERLDLLRALPTYAPAVQALAGLDGLASYLEVRDEHPIPSAARDRADRALRALLDHVFAERSEFGLSPTRFETAYAELERAVYEDRRVSTAIAPLLGLALDSETSGLALGGGLSLVRGDALPDAPVPAVWSEGGGGHEEEPNLLAVLSVVQERGAPSPVALARSRFRRLLSAVRLFEPGGYTLGPIGWTRSDVGPWRQFALDGRRRPGLETLIEAAHEDELRGFFNLVTKRAPATGEIAWALARFEMGCERLAPSEALTDYLLALRALLEPEGQGSGKLAPRLAALCAPPEERAALAQRVGHAILLERAVITGLEEDHAMPEQIDALVDELARHLGALLRDVICGHLEPELRQVADNLRIQVGSTDAAAAGHASAAETLG
jgi:hypothetical protein